MLFASLLFVLAGVFDGVYPGGSAWLVTNGPDVAALSYVFAIINTVVAALVARGSKRSLVSRVGLAGFFVFERPFSAIVLGPKSTASLVTHLVTAIIELVILLSALRVWQLGNSLQPNEADILFALEGSPPPGAAERRETVQPRLRRLPRRSAWLIGGAALVLAILFIADGAYEGFVPGGREWGTSAGSSGWIVYLFAAVALVVTGRAIQGQRLAMRTLIVLSMI